MHVMIFNVMGIWFLVIVGAKTCESLITQVCFHWIDTSY